jgi:hypothetical protein
LFGHYKRIYYEPTGEPQRDWIDQVDNDGVLYYRWIFNEPRVLITSPKALGEVLVQRSYEFVKPARVRIGIGKLLGIGVLLAEGDEHKVCSPCPSEGVVESRLTSYSANESCSCLPFPSGISRICIPSSGVNRRR